MTDLNGNGMTDTNTSSIGYRPYWIDFLSSYIVLATYSRGPSNSSNSRKGSEFVAIATEDGAINVYSLTTGKRLLPTMMLDSPTSLLEAEGDYLMALTALGNLFVWYVTSFYTRFFFFTFSTKVQIIDIAYSSR